MINSALIDAVAVEVAHPGPVVGTAQIEDQRDASDAALQVVQALMALPQNMMVVTLVTAFRPALTPDGELMLCRVDFVVLHDIRV